MSERESSIVRPALFYGDHGASPPLSESRLKQDEYWGSHGKIDIGRQLGSVRVKSNHRNQKSTMKLHQKLTFCPPACPADAHRIIVNEIRNQLLSSIKITSPDRNDQDRSRDVRRSHLPFKLEPVEAGGLWRPWCRCFYYFWHVCCVVLCCCRVVGLWACNVQISTKDLVLKKCLRFAVGF